MRRKRSRPNTEARFKDAVLDLVAESGCGALGVNAVAQKANADKVLLYRYFGDLNGLLATVAEQQAWLPPVDELTKSLHAHMADAVAYLRALFQQVVQHLRSKPTAHQLIRWRKVALNPLTHAVSLEWHTFWQALSSHTTRALDDSARATWAHAHSLVALLVEAELNDEPVDPRCIQTFTNDLPPLKVDA
jgi:AcrR family transcriptional regulator